MKGKGGRLLPSRSVGRSVCGEQFDKFRRRQSSVTKFGENLPFWLKSIKVFGNFSKAVLVFGNILNPFWQKIAIGQSFTVEKGQILKYNQPIWSHWSSLPKAIITVISEYIIHSTSSSSSL